MKHFITLTGFFVFLSFQISKAQVAEWISPNEGLGVAVCSDYFGNSFSAGQFIDTCTIGANFFTASGLQDVIVAKRNSAGQPLWSIKIGGTQSDYAYDIAFDPMGFVWVTGTYNGTISVGTYTLTSAGGSDVFLAKLDAANGTVLHAASGGGTGNDNVSSLRTAASGNVYLSGLFISNFSFGGTPLIGSSYEVYILKLNNTGALEWAKTIGGGAIESMWSMDIDDAENIYVSGFSTSGTTNFAGTSVAMSGNNHFTAKFDAQGQYIWAALSNYNGEIYGTTVDPQGNVYFTGNFDTQASFGSAQLTGLGSDDILLGKINSNGNFEWVQNIGGTSSDQGYSLACNDAGDVFLAGSFQGSITFGTTNLSAGGSSKGYLAKINPDGSIGWVVQSSGSSYSHFFKYVHVSETNEIYVTGYGSGVVNFGGQSTNAYSSYLIKVLNNSNIIQGIVFADVNNDGVLNVGEGGVPNVVLTANSNPLVNAVANNAGVYEMYTSSGNYNVGIPNLPLYYSLTTASSIPVSFTGMGAFSGGNNFGLYPIPNMNDLRIDITNITSPKAGYVLAYQITYKNVGTTALNASVSLQFDPILGYLNAAPAPSGQTSNTLTWNLGLLQPQITSTMQIQFLVPTSAALGYPVSATATISPTSGDQVPADNVSTITNNVTGPYDPNYKEVNIDTLWNVSNPGYLTYTIHFQNIGNDAAWNVLLLDTLSQYLDLPTMEIVSTSHQPMDWRFVNGNVAEFKFENIMLPDSASDPIGSCGFVKFRIKYKSTLPLYESIFNFADIYFDYNPPIRTNTASTIYTINTTSNEFIQSNEIQLFPNPTTDCFVIKNLNLLTEKSRIRILDINGREVISAVVQNSNLMQMNVSKLSQGVYIVEINEMHETKRVRLVKK